METISVSDYLAIAWDLKLYYKLSWRQQLICTVINPKEDPYYPLVQKGTVVFYDKDGVLTQLDTKPVGTIPLPHKSVVVLDAKVLPNIDSKIKTRYGVWLLNALAFAPWGMGIPFVNDVMTPKTIKSYLATVMNDDKATVIKMTKVISELDNVLVTDLNMIGTAAKREMFIEDKEKTKLRNKLVEDNRSELQDPLVQAKISSELAAKTKAHYKEMGAGDFALASKIANVVLSRTEGAYGSEAGMTGEPTKYVDTNLEEGIKFKDVPSYVDTARAGSFSRGALTALGGAEVNSAYLILAGNTSVPGDCKTKEGVTVKLSKDNYYIYSGQALVGTTDFLSVDDLKALIGKTVTLRVPGNCKSAKSTTCAICSGMEFSKFPDSAPTKVSIIDSNQNSAFMAATHGVAMEIVVLDLETYNT